ncbi:MAG: hypothetical protein M3154_02630, partial [Candidatus Eremiobacteraeota bacterium]|nr:hypothetical protein [Candidatus Eremiobacteraeota bacterium]
CRAGRVTDPAIRAPDDGDWRTVSVRLGGGYPARAQHVTIVRLGYERLDAPEHHQHAEQRRGEAAHHSGAS